MPPGHRAFHRRINSDIARYPHQIPAKTPDAEKRRRADLVVDSSQSFDHRRAPGAARESTPGSTVQVLASPPASSPTASAKRIVGLFVGRNENTAGMAKKAVGLAEGVSDKSEKQRAARFRAAPRFSGVVGLSSQLGAARSPRPAPQIPASNKFALIQTCLIVTAERRDTLAH